MSSTTELFDTASALHRAGRRDEAAALYRRIVAQDHGHFNATLNLGALCFTAGADAEAATLLRRALLLRPDMAGAWNNLAMVVRRTGGPAADAEIEALLRRSLILKPDQAGVLSELGLLLESRRRTAEAAEVFARAVALFPQEAEFHHNLAATLRMVHRFGEALPAIRRAVALQPDHANAYNSLGSLLKATGRYGEALANFRRARLVEPEMASAHWNESLLRLLLGDFEAGWRKYEWRWRTSRFPSPQRSFAEPLWDGRPLNGRRLLVYWEQGFGDVLQFVRYLPLVARTAGGPVILECQRDLGGLLAGVPGVGQVVETGQPLPPFDLRIPLMSLPLLFGTRLETIPSGVPYLFTPDGLRDRWRRRIGEGRELTVGLVWAGNPSFADDPLRSPRLAAFASILQVPGVRFFALQKGDGRRDLETIALPPGFTDLGPELGDFADSAAAMQSLDLVISSCTSAAHLAGGLGVPLWVILPAVPDWRWLLDREDCPWYPSARLFRQQAIGDWSDVLERVAAALSGLAAGKGTAASRHAPEGAG